MEWGAFMLNHQKICFFDVDGTLTIECDAQKILVPESTLEALRKAHEAGVLLFANTGRPYGTVHPVIKALPLDGFVCGCGTWIMSNGKEVFRHEIERAERIEIMRKVKELNLSCVYEAKEGFAVTDPLNHGPMNDIVKTYLQDGFRLLEVNDDLVFEKFCLFKNIEDQWPDLSFLKDYDKMYRYGYFVEVVPLACSKGKAIQSLMKKLNVSYENSYSFGDSVNDVEMLKVTKQSIVMGNAPEEVKKLATYVTKTAAENGLYEAMEQLNLLQGEINDKK
jgi:Cof subfamily protein (haloacid dehalogenase superfamily)